MSATSTNPNEKPLVLITGATGHVGYRTLIETLSRGYRVRVAVRSTAKYQTLVNSQSTKPYLNQLSHVIVPDITAAGAFDSAVVDATYIIHIASPLASPSAKDYDAEFIQPAIRGTLSVLESALKAPSVRRVVITSSVVAVLSSKPGEAFTADNTEPDPQGPYANYFAAYSASKLLSYNATRRWIEEQKPGFSVHHVMPTFVVGPNKLATNPKEVVGGSNALALMAVLGGKNPAGTPMSVCHVDDVAWVHVEALDESKYAGNKNWGVNWNGLADDKTWDSAKEIVKKNFPKEVESGLLPVNGEHKSHKSPFDASETERVMGRKFKGWEEMIVDLVGYYVTVSGEARL